jgi:hypothetical protein
MISKRRCAVDRFRKLADRGYGCASLPQREALTIRRMCDQIQFQVVITPSHIKFPAWRFLVGCFDCSDGLTRVMLL